jgi:hypothetical protein
MYCFFGVTTLHSVFWLKRKCSLMPYINEVARAPTLQTEYLATAGKKENSGV